MGQREYYQLCAESHLKVLVRRVIARRTLMMLTYLIEKNGFIRFKEVSDINGE